MLLLETFKVRIFLKIENRWLAYAQMRYQLESTKTIHRVGRWDHLLFGQWLVTLGGQSSAEHGYRSIIFHGRGTIRLANLVETATSYVIMVQYAANLKITPCHFSFRNCSTLISLSKLVVPGFTAIPIGNRLPTFNVLAAFCEIFHSHRVVDFLDRCIVRRILWDATFNLQVRNYK